MLAVVVEEYILHLLLVLVVLEVVVQVTLLAQMVLLVQRTLVAVVVGQVMVVLAARVVLVLSSFATQLQTLHPLQSLVEQQALMAHTRFVLSQPLVVWLSHNGYQLSRLPSHK
jgi:hypothetical protein